MSTHTTHKSVINRLKRAKGHLEKVIQMMEKEEPCLAVAQQLHAVSKAIYKAKQTHITDHIDHCLNKDELSDSSQIEITIKEFKEITKYLD